MTMLNALQGLLAIAFVFGLIYFLVNHNDGKGDRRSPDQIGRDKLNEL